MHLLSLDEATAALKAGKPVVMPTDTVYGVGVAVRFSPSPAPLFSAKGRIASKPVAWLIENPHALNRYGANIPAYAFSLAERFWPGPLTLVVSASSAVPCSYLSDAGTIGLRMADSVEVSALIKATASPLAVTSANFSGKPAVCCADDLDGAFVSRTAGLYRGSGILPEAGSPTDHAFGKSAFRRFSARPSASNAAESKDVCPKEPASTVLDCSGKTPRLLRAGALGLETLMSAGLDLPFS